jgi:hypothetical protein
MGVAGVLLVAAALVIWLAWPQGQTGITPAAQSSPARSAAASPTPTPTPTPTPLVEIFKSKTVSLKTDGFFSWAAMDRRTGEIIGSKNMTSTTWPASMIKSWLASDYLRRATENKQKPSTATLAEIELMIRNSDNNAAQDIYVRNGRGAGIKRLISICKLTDTSVSSKGWSFTNISARDTVRLADCIGDGTAAGPTWTAWLLDKMRRIRVGDFGIRKALPPAAAAKVSIKNGWLNYTDDHMWHVNCLAVTDTWAMAVLQRYPGHGMWDSDFQHGQDVCKQVASQLLDPTVPAIAAG